MEVKYLLLILAMAVVTYFPRYLPLAVLTRIEIPEIIINWLKYIPAAILAALLAPGILLVDGRVVVSYHNIYLLAALPAFLAAIYKRNIFYTVITGVLAVIILQSLI